MKRVISLVASLLFFSAPALAQDNKDKVWINAIDANARRFEKAVVAEDAKTIAAEWLPDGTWVEADGTVHVGRDAIAKRFDEIFHTPGSPRNISVEISSMESAGPNTVVEYGHSILHDAKGQALSAARYTAVHKKVGDTWPIEQLIEYPAQRNVASTADLRWLVGRWSSTNGDKTVTLDNTLSADGKFILSEFGGTNSRPSGDIMVTGVNPVNGRLASWIFDATGGVGRGEWKYVNGTWYLRSMRVEPNGTRVLLTHVLTPTASNAFDWKTTNRMVNGKLIADSEITHVTKVSEVK